MVEGAVIKGKRIVAQITKKLRYRFTRRAFGWGSRFVQPLNGAHGLRPLPFSIWFEVARPYTTSTTTYIHNDNQKNSRRGEADHRE
jgi:hypothetical protein